jgi:dTDP-glucose 4,6-dehydratase
VRVLVAGGAGFLGSHVCDRLVAADHHVVCVDNLCTGAVENLSGVAGNPAFEFVEADVASVLGRAVDIIIHLASPASPVDYDRLPLETMAANSLGTWRLLNIAREYGARMIFVSTSEIYGDPLVHPQPETYWGNVDPIGPRSCYDESKRFGEALVTAYRRTTGVRANVVRFFNTYGPRMRLDDGRVIPEFIRAAMEGRDIPVQGDGSQTRSFCFVDDLVDGLLHVALDPDADGEVFNVGNPAEIRIADLAHAIISLTGAPVAVAYGDRRPGDPERRSPDIRKMQSRYGWTPRTELLDGLATTIRFYADRPAGRPLAPFHPAPWSLRAGGGV